MLISYLGVAALGVDETFGKTALDGVDFFVASRRLLEHRGQNLQRARKTVILEYIYDMSNQPNVSWQF